MMRLDLAAARETWIEKAKTKREKARREKSDFLKYQDSAGRYADFHATRHTFISNLTRVGTSPNMAKTLARHSDINLTMGVYTHLALFDQAAAIQALPAPPGGDRKRTKVAG
jgi:integrase